MSASLVGSEMCIRDRPEHAREDTPEGHAVVGGAECSAGHADLEEGVQPVSYTHLTLPTICSV
eukprot:3237331-Alexandrium_andersonii.AAC.1